MHMHEAMTSQLKSKTMPTHKMFNFYFIANITYTTNYFCSWLKWISGVLLENKSFFNIDNYFESL